MDVFGNERSLHEGVECEGVLLAGLSGLGCNGLFYGVSVSHLAGLESLDVCRAVCNRNVSDGFCKVLEIRVA